MKAASKVIALIAISLFGSFAAFAATPEESYISSCRKDPGVPVPVSVVTPVVGPEYTGTSVEVEFVVDQAGKPANLSVKSVVDDALATAVVDAVKQWKFKPVERNGAPVATKVVLPVKIIDAALEGSAYASAN